MKPRHQISRAAIDLIKRFEGYRAKAARLPDGRWTIGYGHTLTAREGAEVSEKDAEALLLYDLISVAHTVNDLTYTPLNQNQFDALCCFAFNIGLDNFRRSAVLRRLNEGQLLQAACGMELWRKADFEGERIVIDALVRRRAAEKTLFLTPMDGWVPAPSPVLRPNVDADIAGVVPRQTPVAVRAAMEGVEAIAVRDPQATPPLPSPPDEEEAEPSPAQAAAAAISYRLQAIFREDPPAAVEAEAAATPREEPTVADVEVPAEVAAVEAMVEAPAEAQDHAPAGPEAQTAPDLEARPQEDLSAPPPPAPAPMAMGAGGRAFVLTPPEEAPEIEPAPAPARQATDASAENPSGPSLFDRPQPANDALDTPEPPAIGGGASEADIVRLVQEDERHASIMTFEPLPPSDQKAGLASLLTLAGLGLALFAGGLFWAFNARVTEDGLVSPLTVGWVAGILGVALFGLAAYLVLQRLSGEPGDEDEGYN
ncbi:MAG: glycoside hydrolase family protein [Phenylobacterium sp.]|uniref:glycoside hydrolase family protein n=2 Tax=Phenylobacterium sp. TaxID=1871053 RepID=UPI00179D0F29|nr:glycoside hydrolase family protein [Phenylobacterium sp.]MBA4792422.1 glycoside hydrolase family protein [Phenylobacterium sp.]